MCPSPFVVMGLYFNQYIKMENAAQLKMRQDSSYHTACTDFIVKMCERFSLRVVSSLKT